jgi:hypothetical protein
MPDVVVPEPPPLHATTTPVMTTRQTIARTGCQIPFSLLFIFISLMLFLRWNFSGKNWEPKPAGVLGVDDSRRCLSFF